MAAAGAAAGAADSPSPGEGSAGALALGSQPRLGRGPLTHFLAPWPLGPPLPPAVREKPRWGRLHKGRL